MSVQAHLLISSLSADQMEHRLGEFSALLHACVHAGASINFVMPFPMDESEAFWVRKVLPPLRAGSRLLLAAELDGRLAGTVQLDTDTPRNQPHRADVTKLLVHPDLRCRGIGRALMVELEARAVRLGRSLITLDTRTGDNAEPLYRSLGYVTLGIIPGYCLDPFEDRLDAATFMYKTL